MQRRTSVPTSGQVHGAFNCVRAQNIAAAAGGAGEKEHEAYWFTMSFVVPGGAETNLVLQTVCVERIGEAWPRFQEQRAQRLRERERFNHAAEPATERILEDLFTLVLDWSIGDLNHQVGRADLSLTRQGLKWLIVEMKRPGSLAWNLAARDSALAQACRYAEEQKVERVAVSDGTLLYAADIRAGGLAQRLACSLDASEPPPALWWLSLHGIYREPPPLSVVAPPAHMAPVDGGHDGVTPTLGEPVPLLHAKYKRPVTCFAYVGSAADPKTWRLPYLQADGSVDTSRLPKAIQTILSNYRGKGVKGIPEAAIPDVLVRLALAAQSIGKLPSQDASTAPAYVALEKALDQLGRLGEVTGATIDGPVPY